jgi:hypothetical protein
MAVARAGAGVRERRLRPEAYVRGCASLGGGPRRDELGVAHSKLRQYSRLPPRAIAGTCGLEGIQLRVHFANIHVWLGPIVDVALVNVGQTNLGPRVNQL